MGIKIKNLQTGEFEKFNIPALKGEKGEPGEIEPSEKVDYIGKQHSKLRDTMNANVDYIIKTAIGEFNYLDYEGQHITATNSIEGHAKSAILSGQTLVNLLNVKTALGNKSNVLNMGLKSNTKYIFIADVMNNNKNQFNGKYVYNDGTMGNDFALVKRADKGKVRNIFTTPNNGKEIVNMNVYYVDNTNNSPMSVDNMVIIEYQEGMENWDIPYIEGMTSVKAPVLKSVGKNLIDLKNAFSKYCAIDTSNNTVMGVETYNDVQFYVMLEKGKTYRFSAKGVYGESAGILLGRCQGYVADKQIQTININHEFTYIGETGEHTFHMVWLKDVVSNIQLEEASAATPYEPYKSNTLSTPEDLELRGISDVKDTLDCLTGEMTQRIGEVVLDGSEDWTLETHNSWQRYRSTIKDMVNIYDYTNPNRTHCDKLVYDVLDVKNSGSYLRIYNQIAIYNNEIVRDVNQFKQWLSQNPITIQYELATPTIKTVDLSDNNVYSYKDTTHYDCSSADGSLVPTLSVKVPTDTQLTIQEQKATTQTLLIKNMDLQQSIKEVQAINLAFNTALYNSFNSIREEVEDIKKHVSTNENLEGSF